MTESQSYTDNNCENNCEDYEELINNCEPIDALNPDSKCYKQYKQIFKDLQGGVIKNYGRKYSLYIFIQFDKNKVNEVKKWIKNEIAPKITSTWMQLNDTETFRERIKRDRSFSGKLCKNFFLSYQGYRVLECDESALDILFSDTLFEGSMGQNWETNYRIPPEKITPKDLDWYLCRESWDIGNGDQDKPEHEKDRIDAVILLAHDGLEELKNEANTIIVQCEKIGKVVTCEAGYVLRREDPTAKTKPPPVGPFGFADGISQPLFFKADYENYRQNQDIEQWDPKASLNLVLVKDPLGEPSSCGTYCVLQKLETNYERFEEKIDRLVDELRCDRERAYALVMGRFKDGTPLALSDQPDENDGSSIRNSFNYADDRKGTRCPLQAHSRKVNPREHDKTPDVNEGRRKIRIFRAGITYFDDPTRQQTPDLSISQLCLNKLDYLKEVSGQSLEKNISSISGLLFVCFQRSIESQFATIRQDWADSREFPQKQEKYLDPIIGRPKNENKDDTDPLSQEWPNKWNGEQNEFSPFSFYGCVKTRGGEFFFAPSISFLENLKTTYRIRR